MLHKLTNKNKNKKPISYYVLGSVLSPFAHSDLSNLQIPRE